MKRLALLATAFLFASCGLSACGPNNIGAGTGGSDGGSGGSAGTTDGGSGGQTFACPTGSATYPESPYGTTRGSIFPDFFLGAGYWNPNTTPTPDLPTFSVTQTMAFHQLYCSGFNYALIDISAVWCPHCNTEAQDLPGKWVPGWLAKHGIVYSILEEGSSPNVPATLDDLNGWISQYGINYPMAIDPQENLVSGLSLQAWPANIILDLKTMRVVDAVFGATDAFFIEFDNTLNVPN